MKRKRRKSSPCCRGPGRRGMTLIEVLAGLALLAGLLVGVLAVKSRCARQWTHANRRLAAVAAADALLSAWWQEPASFPRSGAGTVEGNAGLAWRTRVVPNAQVNALGATTVRLEVSGAAGSPDGNGPLASI